MTGLYDEHRLDMPGAKKRPIGNPMDLFVQVTAPEGAAPERLSR